MAKNKIQVEFPIAKEFVTSMTLGDIKVIHAYPTLKDFRGRSFPEEVNPRSHEDECLKSNVAKEIKRTLLDSPEEFHLINRGSTILAEDAVFRNGKMQLVITDAENQGLADGATTDAVIAAYQKELTDDNHDGNNLAEKLTQARLHLEIVIGLGNDRDKIARIVGGRNTSRAVKSWSLADFKGEFEWIKEILENEDSVFSGRIGYEENASQKVDVLDILRLLTLFHSVYDQKDEMGRRQAPCISYSGKGRLDSRMRDEDFQPGYKALAPILKDILWLHDTVYAEFEKAYIASCKGKAKLGKRYGVSSRLNGQPYVLPLTGTQSNYEIPSGLIYPLLNSFRALIGYHRDGTAYWKYSPFKFWETHRAEMVAILMEQVDSLGGNPNVVGKKAGPYNNLYSHARLLLQEDKDHKEEKDSKNKKGIKNLKHKGRELRPFYFY